MNAISLRSLAAGWLGGFVGNAVLGAAFSTPWVQAVLYHPTWQSALFIEITRTREIALSVAGLVVLSGVHGVLYQMARPVLPGRHWVVRGALWGFLVWISYWLFQEWFIYVTLLREPLLLALFELVILLVGAVVEGMAIAGVLEWRPVGRRAACRW